MQMHFAVRNIHIPSQNFSFFSYSFMLVGKVLWKFYLFILIWFILLLVVTLVIYLNGDYYICI